MKFCIHQQDELECKDCRVAALQQEVARLREVLEEMPHTLTCSYRERVCSQPGCDEIHVTPCNCGRDAALSTTSAQAEGIKARLRTDAWNEVADWLLHTVILQYKGEKELEAVARSIRARAAQLTERAMQNQEPEVWISELEAAGWHKWRGHSTVWEAPDGNIFRGPYAAWKIMKSSSPAVAKEKP